jgi:hypothetical protein
MSKTATLATLAGVAMASSDPFPLSTSDALDQCLERNNCYEFDWDTYLRDRQDLLGCMNRIGVGTDDPIINSDLFDLITPRNQREELVPCLIEKDCFSKVDLVNNFYDREAWTPCMLGSNQTYDTGFGFNRTHRCINIWDGRPDFFTGNPQNLTRYINKTPSPTHHLLTYLLLNPHPPSPTHPSPSPNSLHPHSSPARTIT